jgi:hypothetical protein
MAVAANAGCSEAGQEAPNSQRLFCTVAEFTGVPDFKIEYVVYRTPKGFRVVGKISQPLDTFSMPLQLRIDTKASGIKNRRRDRN